MQLRFTKMHGLGNDFVVIDAINQRIDLRAEQIRFIADRQFGVGCDQLLLVENPTNPDADFKYRIFNADGSEVSQCGNGARCFARFVRDHQLSDKDRITVETHAGRLVLDFTAGGLVRVNMGVPKHLPKLVPLLVDEEKLLYSVILEGDEVKFSALSMGNPHAVIEVGDVDHAPVAKWGAWLESHPLFPERVNVGFMQIVDCQNIKLRVYERGAAETLACGSGACAAVVTGIERGLLSQNVNVELPGGMLEIEWFGRNQPVFMTGPAISVFEGQIEL